MTQSYRDKTKPWYGLARWKRIAKAQLDAHPLCAMCSEPTRPVAAKVCDHVEPHKGDEAKFWAGPFQSLCKRCHDSDKAMIEAGKAVRRIGADGWPVEQEPHDASTGRR